MFEKVNPSHPDKVADRIAGSLVDLAYAKKGWTEGRPKIAAEVLIGHGECNIIIETSEDITHQDCQETVNRIVGDMDVHSVIARQDPHLAENQKDAIRCGDNGIFRGVPVYGEQKTLTAIAKSIYDKLPYDGKYIIHDNCVTICQSHLKREDEAELARFIIDTYNIEKVKINPLGEWTGGTDVDCGATNRKLGSDMGDAVTGGGLVGKDLSKADVSVNIMCHILAQRHQCNVEAYCSIGDESVAFRMPRETITMSFKDIVEQARLYILTDCGSFEKFAMWGLIR